MLRSCIHGANWVRHHPLPSVFLLRSCSMPCEIPSTRSWRLTIALRCTTSWVSQGPKLKRLKRHPRHPWLAVKALGSNEAGGRFQRVSWSLAKFATGNVGKTQRMGWLMFHRLILRIRQEVSKRAFLRPSWERHRVHPQLEPLFLVRNYITHQTEVRGPGHYFCCSCEKLRWKHQTHTNWRESFQASLISVIYGESLQVQLGVFSGVPVPLLYIFHYQDRWTQLSSRRLLCLGGWWPGNCLLDTEGIHVQGL